MRQLTSLDAQFLAIENSRQSGHVGGFAVLDPSTTETGELGLVDLQHMIAERLPLLPPLRWRLLEVPLGLDYPYWIDDSDFDLDFHVRELAIPAPATDAKIAEQIARIFARPLDRSRPLWEIYLVHGLDGGRVGLLTKIHHAMIDGMSGAEIMGVLFDLDENGREAPSSAGIGSDREPGQFEMLARGIFGLPRYPVRALRSLPRALPMIDETAFGTIPGVQTIAKLAERADRLFSRHNEGGLLERSTLKAPRTSFNGKVSPHRRFVFGQLTLEEVKAVKDEYGCTVNDVVVSICAGAVRRWLIEHQELPDEPLVAQVPISVRTSAQQGTYGNRIMLMSAPLLTNVVDPIDRLRQTHETLISMKERHRALPAELLQDANHFIPPAVFSRAARTTLALSTGQARPSWNLVISNVPGPQFPLYCCGAKVEANYPVSVITDGMGLNITVMSYMGHMDFGIVADRDQMPDLWRLIDYLRDELEELRPAESTADADVTADV